MSATEASVPLPPEEVVRRFYGFLARGQLVDALDLFTTDARFREGSKRESAGIRAIAASLLAYREPQEISVESVDADGPEVRAVVRSKKGRSVGRFSIARGRIQTAQIQRP
jgi:hypothetical protein